MPDTPHPELAIVTRWGPEHPVLLSLASQMLEHGVHFEHGRGHNLLADLPDDLDSYKAIVLDKSAFLEISKDAPRGGRLERFAGAKDRFVFITADAVEGKLTGYHATLFIDLAIYHLVQDILLHAGLSRFAPGWNRQQLAQSDDAMLDRLIARQVRTVESAQSWTEATTHWWKGLKATIEVGGRDDLRPVLIDSIRKLCADIPPALNHDKMGAYFAAAWLYDETGDRGPLDRAKARLDELLAKRPRHMGVPIGCGFADDPLGLRAGEDGEYSYFFSNSTNRKEVLWNEGLHFYGPAFGAMARATGDRRYLDEVLHCLEHIRKYHTLPTGLLAHCSRQGKSNGIAWSRGQAHALIGSLYLLEELKRDDPAFEQVLSLLRSVGMALRKFQDERTGLWRNVIDRPDSRLESSGTTLVCYIYARAVREGWLDRATFEPMVQKAWRGLKCVAWRDGLGSSCRGIGASVDLPYYLGRPQGHNRFMGASWLTMAMLEVRKLGIGVSA